MKLLTTPYKLIIIANLTLLTLSSCLSGNPEKEKPVVKTPSASSSTLTLVDNTKPSGSSTLTPQYTLDNPKPLPTPTKTYQPTISSNPITKAFLTNKDLPGYSISSPPDTFTYGKQSENEKAFFACLGPSAHPLSAGPVKNQLAGDHFYKSFSPNLQAITSSSYFPSKSLEYGHSFLEYIKTDANHEKCLLEFMNKFKGNATNTSDMKLEIIDYTKTLLVTRLTGSDTPERPGINFYTFYTYSENSVLVYTVNVMGYASIERDKLSKDMVAFLSKIIQEKAKLI